MDSMDSSMVELSIIAAGLNNVRERMETAIRDGSLLEVQKRSWLNELRNMESCIQQFVASRGTRVVPVPRLA